MLKTNISIFSLSIFFMLSGHSAFAQPKSLSHDIQSVIDSYLANTGKQEKMSGIEVSIAYPEKSTMQMQNFVAGKTSHDANAKPITSNILFDIGSITKSYTSVMILQLEAEGLLNINDPIGKWFPQYPQWKDVTIKQLLNMTSGIPNYSENPELGDFMEKNLTAEFPYEFLLSYAHPDKPVTPGKTYEYSNSNYILAGMIIEAITKQDFAEALQKRILNPLHLNNTYYPAGKNWKHVNEITFPRKAHGYYYDYDNKKLLDLTNVNLSWGGPAGAIVSTTTDQIKWVNALYHGTLFPEKNRTKLLGELKSVVSMKTGQPIDTVDKNNPSAFGLGIGFAYYQNQRFWFYEGSTLSYRMFYLWKQCNNVTVIAALNSKGGEGNPTSPVTDNIKYLAFDIYQKIIAAKPELMCID